MGTELNGHAAAGALTPATAQVVLADHSNTEESTRRRRATKAEVVLANQDVSRFMPVMDIEQAVARREAIIAATQKLMRPDVDYGKIPGAGDREVLLQPGADKLCNLFGLVIQYEVVKSDEDWTGERHQGTPFFYYEIKGRAYRGDFLMGEGIGSCSSWESKYRWRKAERTCPQCGKANIRKSREGGWYCWAKTEGCGATFRAGDSAIESQETGRKVNPDMADCVNTVLKMAYKRCKVSTTINATSASEFFTQDIEEQGAPTDDDPRGYSIDTGGAPYGTSAAAAAVAARKLATNNPTAPISKPWQTRGEMKRAFEKIREQVGEFEFLSELERYSVRNAEGFRTVEQAMEAYAHLTALADRKVA